MSGDSTRSSLLARVRDPADRDAWREFEELYGELLTRYCLRAGLQLHDAEDVRQAVLMDLARALPGFRYDRDRGRFRGYLARATRNAVSRHLGRHKRPETHLEVSDEASSSAELDRLWEDEWIHHHYRQAMKTLRRTHEERSLAIFDCLAGGTSIAGTAARFEVSDDVVRQVKARIKDKLRETIAAQVAREEGLL